MVHIIADSRDSKWSWLFETCMALPEGTHIEVTPFGLEYTFTLYKEDKVLGHLICDSRNFFSVEAMFRAGVKNSVLRAMCRYDKDRYAQVAAENVTRISQALGRDLGLEDGFEEIRLTPRQSSE